MHFSWLHFIQKIYQLSYRPGWEVPCPAELGPEDKPCRVRLAIKPTICIYKNLPQILSVRVCSRMCPIRIQPDSTGGGKILHNWAYCWLRSSIGGLRVFPSPDDLFPLCHLITILFLAEPSWYIRGTKRETRECGEDWRGR